MPDFIRKTKGDRPVLAICYDFDKTLSPDDMQAQGYIQSVGYEVGAFWNEAMALARENEMDSNLAYMYKMVKEAEGNLVFTKKALADYGAKVALFPGVREWFSRVRAYGEAAGVDVDMYVANYVYEHVADGKTFVMDYRRIFPHETVCSWEEIRPFGITQYLMMHSVYFKTAILRDCGLVLPKHTFYVDNLFMFKPLPDVKTIYYMPLDLYRYFIVRADQSVTLENGAKRYDQQIRVTKMMVDCFDLRQMGKTRPKLRRYLLHELGMMVLICAVFTYADDTPERRKNFYDVWKYIKEKDRWLYRRLRWSSTAMVATGKSKFSRWIDVCGYRFFKRIVKFG